MYLKCHSFVELGCVEGERTEGEECKKERDTSVQDHPVNSFELETNKKRKTGKEEK